MPPGRAAVGGQYHHDKAYEQKNGQISDGALLFQNIENDAASAVKAVKEKEPEHAGEQKDDGKPCIVRNAASKFSHEGVKGGNGKIEQRDGNGDEDCEQDDVSGIRDIERGVISPMSKSTGFNAERPTQRLLI